MLSWLTGKVGQRLWISKGLALPSRTDLKPVGGRKAFLAAAPYVHGWGFPNFTDTYTIMNNDLQAVIAGKQDGRRDAGECRGVAEEVGSTSRPPSVRTSRTEGGRLPG